MLLLILGFSRLMVERRFINIHFVAFYVMRLNLCWCWESSHERNRCDKAFVQGFLDQIIMMFSHTSFSHSSLGKLYLINKPASTSGNLVIILCCFQLNEESTTWFIPFYCRNAFRNSSSPPKQELSDLELLCRKLDPLLAFKVQQTWINTNEITILGHLGSGGLNWDWHWHYILFVMVIESFIASKCWSLSWFSGNFGTVWSGVLRMDASCLIDIAVKKIKGTCSFDIIWTIFFQM